MKARQLKKFENKVFDTIYDIFGEGYCSFCTDSLGKNKGIQEIRITFGYFNGKPCLFVDEAHKHNGKYFGYGRFGRFGINYRNFDSTFIKAMQFSRFLMRTDTFKHSSQMMIK